MPLVPDPARIRLAMLGMVPGNGHPYSWSAIINGRFDPVPIAQGGYPQINQYLSAQPAENLGIPGVQVTHVWCDRPEESQLVAAGAHIPHILARPTDAIGHVDAAVIATDIGHEHLDRARPFIEAGLPVFIDKPLTDRQDHLRQFVAWERAGKPILSTSCMRYAREYAALKTRWAELGRPRLVTITMTKTWDRYGIHALEAVYPLLPPGGWRDAVNTVQGQANHVLLRHDSGVDVMIHVIPDLHGAFGHLHAYGDKGALSAKFEDPFHAFKTQLEAFVAFLRTGHPPAPFDQTVELMKLVIAGIRSREQNGVRIALADIATH